MFLLIFPLSIWNSFWTTSGHKLVPVELIDSITDEQQSKNHANGEDNDKDKYQVTNSDSEVWLKTEVKMVVEDRNESSRRGKNHSPVAVSEEVARISNCETEADVSIGTEIPDLDMADEIQNQDYVLSYESTHEYPLTTFSSFTADYRGPSQVQEQKVELKALAVQNSEHKMNEKPLFHLQLNDIVEDKVPDTPASTPTSVDSLYHLHKKFPLLEKKDSVTEESLDGSVTSELECGDGVVTIEHLKSALRSERKTLRALYAELEEERSASAVAANQTMAMINRLQEEKAAVQMEALQYQRMMEEQSEYDQEALQLLNELMVKREKEKQELEKELEIYRKKVLEYETKEKMRTLRKSKDGSTRSGFSSASYSNGEDSDGLSIDLNQEAKVEESFYSHLELSNQNTPVDAALNLDESLADFEEERLSILEQLKLLEEKLMTLDIQDQEVQNFVDFRPIEDFHEENGNHMDENAEENGNHVDENAYFGGEANGHANGFTKEINGKHHQQRRIVGSNGKRLLPLFDAISDENGNVVLNENGNGFESNVVHNSYESKLELYNKKFVIVEEVDHLYERLQALEADREFLKHCISSLRKGDKGMDLLQEILQHLRDLRNVEFRVRNLSDTTIV
ncbi:Myosin-binding protein 2 [Forsythia ovata]|uniref:Myosin-binding protein 2 n=1 Tax=Forsythia ovata TaxID=205694 RepID=A0ABD1XEF1_9LAMI